MRPSKRQFNVLHSLQFTQCAPPNVRISYSIHSYLPNTHHQMSCLDIPFHPIYPMSPTKRPSLAFTFPAIYPNRTPNVPFTYSIPRHLLNAQLQSNRLAIPFPAIYQCAPPIFPFSYSFPAIYPMRPSKRPVYLFHSLLFSHCTTPIMPFCYSIPRYLDNALL